MTFPIRTLLIKSFPIFQSDHAHTMHSINILLACTIIIIAAILAILLRNHFASVCGFIGSFVTTINAIILPIIFYHKLSPRNNHISIIQKIFHLMLIVFAIFLIFFGIESSICDLFIENNKPNFCYQFV